MKNLFFIFALAAVVGLGLTSCDDTEHCWIITTKTNVAGKVTEVKMYFWGTADQADEMVTSKSEHNVSVNVSKSKANDVSQSDCNLFNPVK